MARFSCMCAFAILGFCSAGQVVAQVGSAPKLELVLQTGHSGNIYAIALTPDGKYALTGSHDGLAILWDANSGRKLRAFTAHAGEIRAVAFAADGSLAIAGYFGGLVCVWDTQTGKEERRFTANGQLTEMAVTSDGRYAIVPSSKGADLWDTITGKIVWSTNTHFAHVSLSADGSRAVIGNANAVNGEGSVIVWDAMEGKKRHVLDLGCASAALSSDGKVALISSGRKTVLIETATAERLQTFDGYASQVGLTADGSQAITLGIRTVTLWDCLTGKKLHNVALDNAKTHFLLASTHDLKTVLVGQVGRTSVLWDTTTGTRLRTLTGRISSINSIAATPDGNQLAVASDDKLASLWHLTSGKKTHSLVGHSRSVYSIAMTTDGDRVLTAGGDDEIAIFWNAVSGQKIHTFQGHSARINAVALSPDGKKALTGSWDKTAVLWDTISAKKIQRIAGGALAFTRVALSSQGDLALSGGGLDKNAILWNTVTGQKLHSLGNGEFINCLAFSSDGKKAVTGSNVATIWDAASGKKIQSFDGHRIDAYQSGVASVTLSTDGKRIVTGSGDGSALLWDATTAEKIHRFTGHESSVSSVALIGDQKFLITGSRDGTCRLWSIETGRELCSLISFDDGKDWLVTTPDGYFDGSENAAKYISYRITGTLDFVPLERYHKQFERPGLLAMIYKGEDYRNKDIKQDLPPIVRVTAPGKSGRESKDGKLTVEAEAQSRGEYPVTSLRLLVNGRPYPKKFGIFEIADPKPGKAAARWDIELEPGRHTIEVHAHTKAVFGVSESVEVRYVGGNSNPNIELPSLYVLAVGISKYPAKEDRLDFAHKDAEAIARAIETHGKPLFKRIEVKVLTDEKATREEIMDGLDWLRRNMTQRDFGVFFFAGHGMKDETDTLYFLPADVNKDKLARSAIDGDVLAKELMKTVGQLTVILDACHSGAIGGNKYRGLTENLLRDLTSEEKGIAMMCSASGRQKAQESREHQHGMFTLALIEGLSGKGNGKSGKEELNVRLTDGAVYFKQLDAYVTDRVKELSRGYQHPVTSIPRAFRDFPFSRPKDGG